MESHMQGTDLPGGQIFVATPNGIFSARPRERSNILPKWFRFAGCSVKWIKNPEFWILPKFGMTHVSTITFQHCTR